MHVQQALYKGECVVLKDCILQVTVCLIQLWQRSRVHFFWLQRLCRRFQIGQMMDGSNYASTADSYIGGLISLTSKNKIRFEGTLYTVDTNIALQSGSINRALAALLQYANREVVKGSDLNELLVPLVEHVVKSRDRGNSKVVISILVWLFQDVDIGKYVMERFATILQSRQVNNRAKLGWCLIVRGMLRQRMQTNSSSNGLSDTRLIPFVRCIPNLFDLTSESSSKGMPTRMSMMAADCIILISKFMGENPNLCLENKIRSSAPDDGLKQLNISASTPSTLCVLDPAERNSYDTSTFGLPEVVAKEELLWDHLDTLLKFVFKLRKWNEEIRPLYATGLQQIAKCLENLVYLRDALGGQGEKDMAVLKAVLSSCFNHYAVLMLIGSCTSATEFKVMLEQWIEGLQHSFHIGEMEGECEASPLKTTGRVEEIRIFFLTCLTLLLGRLSMSEIEGIVQECGPMLMQALFGQLHSKNADVVDLAIAILRTLLFQAQLANVGTLSIDTVAPLLMDLLDERDSASRAVVALVADYFAINPCAPEMERLFGILGSGNSFQRQNALGVLSELLRILSSSDHDMANSVRQTVAAHLLKRLGDAELANRMEVSRLFSELDPEFVLPALVQHLYSRDEKVRSAASSSIVSVLKGHSQPCAALCALLDCARNMSQKAQLPMHPGHIGDFSKESSLPDLDRIMRLIPSWACEVQEWEKIIDVILSKMFSEPSNPVIPRFLSHISSQLLDNIGLVFKRIFVFMAEQPMLSEDHMQTLNDGHGKLPERLNSFIFERLSPLLVLKVLPLEAFDENRKVLYGSNPGSMEYSTCEELCIARFLMDRACGKYEAHEVRKLAAELLGRCNPKIMLPLLKERLENALDQQSAVEIKSYLFSLCNLVLVRGNAAVDNPWMPCIQTMLKQILLWPCSPTDTETFNMQHGAIDCLALMIVAELNISTLNDEAVQDQHPSVPRHFVPKIIKEVEADTSSKDAEHQQILAECKESQSNLHLQESVLSWVVSSVIGQHQAISFLPNHNQLAAQATKPTISASGIMLEKDCTDQITFCLCCTNVLIRATQKLAPKGRHHFLLCVLAPVMDFVQADKGSHIKSACLQLLFSIVHNFKEQILSYAVDLFNLSLKIMRSKASSEERLAATRLFASIITSADVVLHEVAPYLPEALVTLESIAQMDASSELRGFCEKLLECMTPSTLSVKPFL